jgi:hypothetical protein
LIVVLCRAAHACLRCARARVCVCVCVLPPQDEFERMRVSVEEMVYQKSYQLGRAQASTLAVPSSRRAPRRYGTLLRVP